MIEIEGFWPCQWMDSSNRNSNAWQLQHSHFGLACESPTADVVVHFFYRGEEFNERLKGYPKDDGSAIKTRLRGLVENDAALAKEFKRNRN